MARRGDRPDAGETEGLMARRGDGLYLRGKTWYLDCRLNGTRHVVRLGKSITRSVASVQTCTVWSRRSSAVISPIWYCSRISSTRPWAACRPRRP